MQEKSMTVEQFDIEVAKLVVNLRKGRQAVQDLANEAVIHAAMDSDYTFFTKLFLALPRGVKSGQIKSWIEHYGGCKWDKEATVDGQFKKNHDRPVDSIQAVKADNAWWTFKGDGTNKPFDPVQFFVRQTKTVGNKGKDDLFNKEDPVQQEAVNDLIRAIKNEGFNIPNPTINTIEPATAETIIEDVAMSHTPATEIPDWRNQVEEEVRATA